MRTSKKSKDKKDEKLLVSHSKMCSSCFAIILLHDINKRVICKYQKYSEKILKLEKEVQSSQEKEDQLLDKYMMMEEVISNRERKNREELNK